MKKADHSTKMETHSENPMSLMVDLLTNIVSAIRPNMGVLENDALIARLNYIKKILK